MLPRCSRFLLLFQFSDDGGTIFIAGIGKQIALLAGQCFALAAKADALMVGQFEGELLDLQLAPFEFSVALDEPCFVFDKLKLQGRYLRPDPIRQCRIDCFLGQFSGGIHGTNYIISITSKPL